MTNFKRISYDEVSEIINRACPDWNGSDNVSIDETKITVAEMEKLRMYLNQNGYIQEL